MQHRDCRQQEKREELSKNTPAVPKKKNFDFTSRLNDRRIRIRFYPQSSSLYLVDGDSPKITGSIYKVYYSWAVFESWRWDIADEDGNAEKSWKRFRRVFYMPEDECSCLAGSLAEGLRAVLGYKKKSVKLSSFGYPGSMWRIECTKGETFNEDELTFADAPELDTFTFEVFDNSTCAGYRFFMDRNGAEEFCRFLDDINRYMLKNGKPV